MSKEEKSKEYLKSMERIRTINYLIDLKTAFLADITTPEFFNHRYDEITREKG